MRLFLIDINHVAMTLASGIVENFLRNIPRADARLVSEIGPTKLFGNLQYH